VAQDGGTGSIRRRRPSSAEIAIPYSNYENISIDQLNCGP
jgi:hypothetical protein